MGETTAHDELLEMAKTIQIDERLDDGHTTVYKTGEKWHSDPSCHHLRRGGVYWLRLYPLERAFRFRYSYSTPCSYCVPDRTHLRWVIDSFEPDLVDGTGARLTTLEEWEGVNAA